MTVVENFAFEDMQILNPRINSRGDGNGIFRMEFPLMQWVFAWFYKWFGADLTIARVLSFLIYLVSVIGFYRLLRTYKQTQQISSLGAWCFAWSPVMYYYAVNPLPDNLALCFTVWSLGFLKGHEKSGSSRSLAGFGIFLSLAAAVKLPYIIFGVGYIPTFVRLLKVSRFNRAIKHAGIVLLNLSPAIAWYAWVIPQWTNTALIGGIGAESKFDYQSALSNMWGVFHSMLPELLVNYGSVIFLLAGIIVLVLSLGKLTQYLGELLMFVVVVAYYLYEVNMIGLAHDYYLFPFLPLLFLIITSGVKYILNHDNSVVKSIGYLALIILPLTASLRATDRWRPMGMEKELLAHKEELRSIIPNGALVVAGNDASTHIVLYHIGQKGWTFEQDWLSAEDLELFISNGAKYLYSNSATVDSDPTVVQFLEDPVFDKDGIKVYPLKSLSDS